MTHKKTILLSFLFMSLGLNLLAQPSNFETSLHKTRAGKNYWYGTVASGGTGGFETLTGVPITHPNVACAECHGATDASGNAYPSPYPGASCADCHPSGAEFMNVSETQCLSCHSRQKAEQTLFPGLDVHKSAASPLACWDCHGTEDMHGDGTQYNSMFEPGAIRADCENCHTASSMPADHKGYDPHGGKLHCTACHAESVIACYNCHFESQVESAKKRAKQQIKDFVLLVNREKDGKVYSATFQSLTYQGNTWTSFAPYTAHNITSEGRTCVDCHNNFGAQLNEAIKQYNTSGEIYFAKWNSADSTLSTMTGIIPIPSDYVQKLKMDYLTYLGGTNDPIAPSKNWAQVPVNPSTHGYRMMFATPLTKKQMAKIGFDTTLTNLDSEIKGQVPEGFRLEQNYPNPFNPSTTIRYSIAKEGNVKLLVFDNLGRLVSTLVDKNQKAGNYSVEFDAETDNLALSSGIYYYKLQTQFGSITKKLILLK